MHLTRSRALHIVALAGALLSSCTSAPPPRAPEAASVSGGDATDDGSAPVASVATGDDASHDDTSHDEARDETGDAVIMDVASYLAAADPPEQMLLVHAATGRVAFRTYLEDSLDGGDNDHLFVIEVGARSPVLHITLRDSTEDETPSFEPTLAERRAEAARQLAGFVAYEFTPADIERGEDDDRIDIHAPPDGDDIHGPLLRTFQRFPRPAPFWDCARDDESGRARRGPREAPGSVRALFHAELGLLVIEPGYPQSDLCLQRSVPTFVVRLGA